MVVTLAANGVSMKEVGRRLGISPRTAESDKYSALSMLGIRSKAALVDFALRQGLLGLHGAPITPAADLPGIALAAEVAFDRGAPGPPLSRAPDIQSGIGQNGIGTTGISRPTVDSRAVITDFARQSALVGDGAAMQDIVALVARFATYDAPILITGESGTGKETVARAVHSRSARAAGPFVVLSCASYGGSVLSGIVPSEAPGNGQPDRDALFGKAHGGTLFLDEIGDMPGPLQVGLLRFLQASESAYANGLARPPPAVRIIAATSSRAGDALVPSRVREDLYYRLDVLRLNLPPLRERRDGLPSLATHILQSVAAELQRDVRGFAPETLALMQQYEWPGNIRQLIAAIRRAVVLTDTPLIRPIDLQLDMPLPVAPTTNDEAVAPAPGTVAEREQLLKALRENGFNISRTAQALGRSRVTLYRMLARNGLAQHHEFVVRDNTKLPV